MPERRTDDVVRVVMTDHYIQRLKSNRDLLAPKPEIDHERQGRDGVVPYYPPKLQLTAVALHQKLKMSEMALVYCT
jgi:hypothetical protein